MYVYRGCRFWLCLPRSDYSDYVQYMFSIEYEAISLLFVHILRSDRHPIVKATEFTAADVALPNDNEVSFDNALNVVMSTLVYKYQKLAAAKYRCCL